MNLVHKAATNGWQTALVESSHLGGTCINIGCIPSKTLIYSAKVMKLVAEAESVGVLTAKPRVDWPAMVRRKDRLVERIRSRSYRTFEENARITLFEEEAQFTGTHELFVNGATITAEKIVIAAGARTAVPRIPGLDKVDFLTSTSIMEMAGLPKSLLILGGGIIALEFSQLFTRLGVEVTILQRDERLAPALEPEISEEIRKILEDEGVKVKTGVRIIAVEKENNRIIAADEKTDGVVRYSAEKLLVATGRMSNGDRLNLEKAGVETDERGYIRVNSAFETNVDGIWAIGDITGGAMFTHRAWHDGMLLGRGMVDGIEISSEGRLIPFAIFTDPEIAGIGMGEKGAAEAGYKVRVKRFKFGNQGRALAMEQVNGFVKLVIQEESGKLLGAHLIGTEAGELIHELIMAIRLGATVYDLQDMMHVHPTISEAIGNAARSV